MRWPWGLQIRDSYAPAGAAEGCDLLIFEGLKVAKNQDQKIAACGSSYRDSVYSLAKSIAVSAISLENSELSICP
jgi:hypothetical protein